MERVRFGLGGCGLISLIHAWAISTLENAELVAVSDVNEEAARTLGQRFGAQWHTKYSDLLARDDIDAVAVLTPSGLHAEHAIAAAEAGKHVLVEKPLATSLKAADQMIRACAENHVKLGGIFNYRFMQASQHIRRAIEEGRFGRLICGGAYVKWYRLQKYYDIGTRGTQKSDGGGALINQSIHVIDLLQWMMGPVTKVFGRTGTLSHRAEVEDIGVASLQFENGAFGTIEGTTSAYPGLFFRLEVNGSEGSAAMENTALKTWQFADKRDNDAVEEEIPSGHLWAAGPGVGVASGKEDPNKDPSRAGVYHRDQYRDFLKAIVEDGQPLVDGKEAKKALEIILAIYRSAREGREVTLPLED